MQRVNRRRTARLFSLLCAGLFLFGAARSKNAPAMLGRIAMISAAFTAPDAAAAALRSYLAEQAASEAAVPQAKSAEPAPAAETIEENEAPAAAPEPAPKILPEAEETEPDDPLPPIPDAYRGTVQAEDFAGYEGGPYYQWGRAWLRNCTDVTAEELDLILATPSPIADDGGDGPLVLLYHTHATESFCTRDDGLYDTRCNWRSTDTACNMVAVGDAMARTLEARGIAVIHDTELHDYPSYDGSYASSAESIRAYLEEHPSIRVVLDLHRDAIERSAGLIVKPLAEIDGEACAQLMIISNCDDGSGLIPNWRENLRFAAAFADAVEARAPGLTRPILFSHRKYNQQLSTGALLLEFGSNANTLAEAKLTAVIAGEALADFLQRE